MKTMFLKPNNPFLTRISKKISKTKLSSFEIRKDIKAMTEVACGEQKDKTKPVMVGLAAPQIGILKRIILVDVKANGTGEVGDLKAYINPEIIWKSKKQKEWYEGCYSTDKVCGIVSRSKSIKIKAFALNILGLEANQPLGLEVIEEKYTGYVARIFQHEIDHLNGIRFPNHITDPSKLHWVKKSKFPLYRDKQAWRNWPEKCTFEKWLRLKSGKS